MQQEIIPPTRVRRERGEVVIEESDPSRGGLQFKVAPSLTYWPLEYYRAHKLITGRQCRAGNKFYAVWITSKHIHPHVQSRYEEFTPGDLTACEQRYLLSIEYLQASRAIRGLIPRKVAEKVCLNGRKAGAANMVYLRAALDDLATYFWPPHGNRP